MEFLSGLWTYVIPFLAVLTVLVFVHEMGHYLVARWCGVRIQVFSIGFGPEIWGFTDRKGTRWKFSWVPFGGYVKMFGEQQAEGDDGREAGILSEEDREVSFFNKSLGQRSAIVFAGPAANFLFAIVVLAGLFSVLGQPYTPPDIGQVVAGSAAERAGLRDGDVFKRIGSTEIQRFEQVQQIVQLAPGQPLEIVIERAGERIAITAIPDSVEVERFGTVHRIGQLGVSRPSQDMVLVRHDPFTAVWKATERTFSLTGDILKALGQIITGRRTVEELGGPVRIAQISGDMAQIGLVMLIQFAAILSINLGLINLFPIPMLDGGHLVFYALEAVRGRPVDERVMGYSLNIGLLLILGLTLFVTWNDLVQLRIIDYFIGLAT
jgi:regulator of sigma E protease